jgi:hypothetical protein
MMKSFVSVLALVCLPARGLIAADDAWLPARVADNAARQLAERLEKIGLGGADDGKRLSGARRMIAAMAEELDHWGVRGLLDRTPRFAAVVLPASGGPALDSMVRYQMCNLVLLRQLEDPAFADDENALLTSTLGLSAVTLAILRLRQSFLDRGGEAAEVERVLTSPRLEPIVEGIQKETALRRHVESRCQPVVVELLSGPLERLGDRSGGD